MDQRLLTQWAETERLLQGVLAGVDGELEPERTAWVREYLEHNELGLAYETLAEAIRDKRIDLDAEAVAALDAARELMQLKD